MRTGNPYTSIWNLSSRLDFHRGLKRRVVKLENQMRSVMATRRLRLPLYTADELNSLDLQDGHAYILTDTAASGVYVVVDGSPLKLS